MRKILVVISLTFLGSILFGNLRILLAQAGPKPRYISLAPSTTEILFALGLDTEIVGVSSYCDYPKAAEDKEKVGDFSQPNIEKIIFLKPDCVFCTGLEQAPIITKLRQLNLRVYVADPVNIKGLFNSIRDISKITHKEKEAERLIKEMENQIEAVASQAKLTPQAQRPKVFIEIWHDPLTTAGKGSFIDELITLAGAVNIAYDTRRPYSIFSPEEVISRNQDYIILAYMDKENPVKLRDKRFGWSNISAVKNNRVYNDINPDILLRPGPRIVEGLREIYKRLHR